MEVLSFPLTLCSTPRPRVCSTYFGAVNLGSLSKSDAVLEKPVYTGHGAVLAGSGLPDPRSEGTMIFLVR